MIKNFILTIFFYINNLISIFSNFFKISNLQIDKEIDLYPYKYENEFNELDNNELDDNYFKRIKDIFIDDNTPNGIVYMNYNVDDDLFIYYSDKTNIQYRFLDTVAMKYVIANNCKKIYKFMKDEIQKINYKKQEEEDKEKEKEKEEKKNDVFVNFKKYNKKINNTTIKENLNRFKRMGNLIDYENYLKNVENLKNNTESNKRKKFNYKEYKNCADC